jgi:hypothetical protein
MVVVVVVVVGLILGFASFAPPLIKQDKNQN